MLRAIHLRFVACFISVDYYGPPSELSGIRLRDTFFGVVRKIRVCVCTGAWFGDILVHVRCSMRYTLVLWASAQDGAGALNTAFPVES